MRGPTFPISGSSTPTAHRFPGARCRWPRRSRSEVALVARGRVDDVVSVVVDRGPAPKVIDRIELEVPDRDFVGAAEVLGKPHGRGGLVCDALDHSDLRSPRRCERTQHDGAVPSDGLPLPPRSGTRRVRCHRRDRGTGSAPAASGAGDCAVPDPRAERATVVRLDLGFVNVPVDAIRVQSSTDRFVRSVTVEGSERRDDVRPGRKWRDRPLPWSRPRPARGGRTAPLPPRHRHEWRRRCARGPSRDSARQLAPAPARRWPPAALRRLLRRRGHRRSGVRLRPVAGCRDRLRTSDASARSAPKPSTTSSSRRRTRARSSRGTTASLPACWCSLRSSSRSAACSRFGDEPERLRSLRASRGGRAAPPRSPRPVCSIPSPACPASSGSARSGRSSRPRM